MKLKNKIKVNRIKSQLKWMKVFAMTVARHVRNNLNVFYQASNKGALVQL